VPQGYTPGVDYCLLLLVLLRLLLWLCAVPALLAGCLAALPSTATQGPGLQHPPPQQHQLLTASQQHPLPAAAAAAARSLLWSHPLHPLVHLEWLLVEGPAVAAALQQAALTPPLWFAALPVHLHCLVAALVNHLSRLYRLLSAGDSAGTLTGIVQWGMQTQDARQCRALLRRQQQPVNPRPGE
jgi:hypothetical protein